MKKKLFLSIKKIEALTKEQKEIKNKQDELRLLYKEHMKKSKPILFGRGEYNAKKLALQEAYEVLEKNFKNIEETLASLNKEKDKIFKRYEEPDMKKLVTKHTTEILKGNVHIKEKIDKAYKKLDLMDIRLLTLKSHKSLIENQSPSMKIPAKNNIRSSVTNYIDDIRRKNPVGKDYIKSSGGGLNANLRLDEENNKYLDFNTLDQAEKQGMAM